MRVLLVAVKVVSLPVTLPLLWLGWSSTTAERERQQHNCDAISAAFKVGRVVYPPVGPFWRFVADWVLDIDRWQPPKVIPR